MCFIIFYIIFNHVTETKYKEEWLGWEDWLGESYRGGKLKLFLPFEEARESSPVHYF